MKLNIVKSICDRSVYREHSEYLGEIRYNASKKIYAFEPNPCLILFEDELKQLTKHLKYLNNWL